MQKEALDEGDAKQVISIVLSVTGRELLEKQAAAARLSRSDYLELLVVQAATPVLMPALAIAETSTNKPQSLKWKALRRRDEFLIALAEVMIEKRQALGYSQSKIAGDAGLHRTYISDIENGSRNVTMESLARLSFALKVSVANLCKAAEDKLRDLA